MLSRVDLVAKLGDLPLGGEIIVISGVLGRICQKLPEIVSRCLQKCCILVPPMENRSSQKSPNFQSTWSSSIDAGF